MRLSTLLGDILMDVSFFIKEKQPLRLLNNGLDMLLSKKQMAYLEIINIADYCQQINNSERQLLYSNRTGLSQTAPILNANRTSTTVEGKLADINLTHFHNVCFHGGSDILIDVEKKLAINDFCYDLDDSIYFIDGLLTRIKRNRCLIGDNLKKEPKLIESGIILSGKFANNFYHCLYENLNRLLVVNQDLIPNDVPLLVDEQTYNIKTLKEVLGYLNRDKREIIVIKANELYKCKSLYYIDHLHRIIPHHKVASSNSSTITMYDPVFLKKQADVLFSYGNSDRTPKRVFLSRKGTTRRNYNEEEVWKILKKYDFESIDPVQLSYSQQIYLFANAELIVGGSGAAFSNLIFSKKTCTVICFRSVVAEEGPSLFNVLTKAGNCSFWNYNPSSNKKTSIHSDYYIDPAQFEKNLNEVIKTHNDER